MNLSNDLLIRTAKGELTDRPPIWLMRQAGRILPQYRALRSRLSGFKELVQTPELAAEVTIQPVDELGVDAAIIFSDILVIPEAMGLDYELVEKKGPLFPKTIQNQADIDHLLSGQAAAERLAYVYDALRLTKEGLAGRVPLIGFAGAPWTIFAYMLEGSGSKTFSKAKRFLYQEPKLAHALMEKITESTIAYLKMKIQHGADIVQVFDSWAGILTPQHYQNFALRYIREICAAIQEVPVIVFAKGAWFALGAIDELDCQVIGLDWNIKAQDCRMVYGEERVFQGNMDPCCLYAKPETIQSTATKMMQDFGGHHVVNLGHGLYPDTPLENVKCFVETVKSFRY